MLTTDSRLYRAIQARDGDALRAAVAAGTTRRVCVGAVIYDIRRETRSGRDIIIVRENGRFLFSESVPAE